MELLLLRLLLPGHCAETCVAGIAIYSSMHSKAFLLLLLLLIETVSPKRIDAPCCQC